MKPDRYDKLAVNYFYKRASGIDKDYDDLDVRSLAKLIRRVAKEAFKKGREHGLHVGEVKGRLER
jgi:hypothetical protein